MLKPSEIREKYPKSVKFIADLMIEGFEKEANLIKEQTGQDVSTLDLLLPDQIIDHALIVQPRGLFDFFDFKGIKIGIIPSKEDDSWTYWNTEVNISSVTTSRLEADKLAIVEAFKTLEAKL